MTKQTMTRTILLILSTVSVISATSVSFLEHDPQARTATIKCSYSGSRTDYPVKVYKNNEIIYDGSSLGVSGDETVKNKCGSTTEAGTGVEEQGFSSILDLKPGERSIFCRGINPDVCSDDKRSTFFGYHSYHFSCNKTPCTDKNVITGQRDLPPLYTSAGLTNHTLDLGNYITMSTYDASVATKWKYVQTLPGMKSYMTYFIAALRKYKKLEIIQLDKGGTIPMKSGVEKYMMYLNKKECGRKPGDLYYESGCPNDLITFRSVLKNSDSAYVAQDNMFCADPISFLLFSELRDVDPYITFLKNEMQEGSYNSKDLVNWHAGVKCGINGVVEVGILTGLIDTHMATICQLTLTGVKFITQD